jgi:hypothetical protein
MRNWCLHEWFYAGIDRPFFYQNDFKDILHQFQLQHVQKMTRVEWGAVRASMGRSRRLSAAFLREERNKLDEYRRNIRCIQQGRHEEVSLPYGVFPFDVPGIHAF